MIKIMTLLFVVIAPTVAGIAVVAVLAMSSPINGGTPLSQQGSMILMVVAGATLVALPISFIVAKMISRTLGTAAPVAEAAIAVQAPAIPAPLAESQTLAQTQAEALAKAEALIEQAKKI